MKNILRRALDMQPMPTASVPAPQTTFRFARSVRELLEPHLEVTNEPN